MNLTTRGEKIRGNRCGFQNANCRWRAEEKSDSQEETLPRWRWYYRKQDGETSDDAGSVHHEGNWNHHSWNRPPLRGASSYYAGDAADGKIFILFSHSRFGTYHEESLHALDFYLTQNEFFNKINIIKNVKHFFSLIFERGTKHWINAYRNCIALFIKYKFIVI